MANERQPSSEIVPASTWIRESNKVKNNIFATVPRGTDVSRLINIPVDPKPNVSNEQLRGVKWRSVEKNAIQVATTIADGQIIYLVRNGRDPQGPVLKYTLQEWISFLEGISGNEFDKFGNS